MQSLIDALKRYGTLILSWSAAVREQTAGRDALVDDVRRHRPLHQGLAVRAGPFAANWSASNRSAIVSGAVADAVASVVVCIVAGLFAYLLRSGQH